MKVVPSPKVKWSALMGRRELSYRALVQLQVSSRYYEKAALIRVTGIKSASEKVIIQLFIFQICFYFKTCKLILSDVFKAEVSDQNFVNEVTKDENGSSKKMKTVMNNGSSSSTDQVNFNTPITSLIHTSPRRECDIVI